MSNGIYGAENSNVYSDDIKQTQQGETALNRAAFSDQVNTGNAGIM